MFPKGKDKCKKIGFIFISIALSVLLLSVFASAYSNETVIVGSTVVNPGVSFSLPVFVDNITNIRLLSLDIFFENSSLHIDNISVNNTHASLDPEYYIDNSTGFANTTLYLDDVSSENELQVANLMFRSLVSGYYDIVIRNVSFSNDTTSFPADYVVNGSVRVNFPPVIDYIENKTVDVGSNLNFSISATDQDDINLSYGLEGLPDGYYLNSSNGSFSWTPTEIDVGNHSVSFSVSDGYASNFTSAIIFVNEISSVIDNPPVLLVIGNKSVNETEILSFVVHASDIDTDPITYSADVLPGNSTLNETSGEFNWVTDYSDAGEYVVEFIASSTDLTDSETISINISNINRAPVLSKIGNWEVNESNELTFTVSGSDADDETLSYSCFVLPDDASFNNVSGVFSWTPDYNDSGAYSLTFIVNDGGLNDSETISIEVLNVNRAPVLSAIGSQNLFENSLLEITLSAQDNDLEDILTYSTNASFGNLSENIFTWIPDSNDSGIYNVEFNVTDGSLVDSEIVTITVANVNNVPVLSAIGEQDVSENETLEIILSANDADSGDILSYSSNATFGNLSNSVFTWIPDYDAAGTYVVEFTVSDSIDSDSETVVINVKNTNRAPVLSSPGYYSVAENSSLMITLSATDPDPEDSLHYNHNATFGSLENNVFTWTPGYNDSGVYNVEFNVSDGIDSDSETVVINVKNTNRAPVLSSPGYYSVAENSSLMIPLSATDPDPEDSLHYNHNATFGSLENNVFTWTPGYNDSGVYNVEFNVSDGIDSDSEVVVINVVNINRAPVLSSPGYYSVAENSSLMITLSATDPDPEDPLYYNHNATFGSLENNVFTWIPDYNSSGIHAVEFTVSDGNLSDSAVAVITVNNTNRPPYIEPIDDKLVNENEELIIEINGSDPDFDPLTYKKNVNFGSLVDNIFTWKPDYNDSGLYDVSFTVSDGNLSYTEDIKIAVGNTNVPPVLDYIGGKTVNENQYLSFTIKATDEDSADILTYLASGLPTGASFNNQTRQFSWTPTYNQSGTHNVVFEVSDGLFTDTELVPIVVNNINIAPVLASIGNITVNENSEISFIVTATDHDKDSLIYSISNPSQIGTFNSITHEFRWSPDYDSSGIYNLTFTVSDNVLSDSETIYIEVLNVNRAPELNSIGNKVINETEELSFTISANDPDYDFLEYSASGIPDGSNFDTSTQTFTWTPDYDDSGTYDVTFNVSDGSLFDSETITISVGSVNRPPELTPIGDKTAVEGSELIFTITANDPDKNDLSYFTSVLPLGADFDTSTQTFTWTPDYDQAGIQTITFTVSDGDLSDSETISIDVLNTNRAPTLSEIGNKNVAEGEELSFTIIGSDPDSESLIYSATDLPGAAEFDPGTREFSWTPNYGESGTYSVTFNVTDGDLSDSETIIISVGLVNRAPELESIGYKTINENSTLHFTISATDPDEDPLEYSTSELPDGADFDETSHAFSWTPDYNQEGSYSITFSVNDGNLSDSETIYIDVLNTNRAPVLSEIGNMNVSEGEKLSFTISGNDPDNNLLSYSALGVPDGADFNQLTRSFSWTPNYEDSGSYEVTFTVSDGSLSDSETIIISVDSVNRPPVLSSIGNKEINENSELLFFVSATDPDYNDLSYSIINEPEGVDFDGVTGQFRWIPDYDASGTYSVTFKVSDGSLTDSETIAITVHNINRAPVLENIGNKQVNEGTELSFTVSASDDDGNSLIYYSTGVPQGANFDPDTRKFSWIPDYDESGSYSVTFYVSDGYLVDSETITISVGSVNRAPEIDPIGDKAVDEGSELRFTVSGSDPDSNEITYSATGLPEGADFDEDTQEFIWNPDYDQSGTYNVTFMVSDGLLSDLETIAIIVNHVNRAPVLSVIGDVSTDENELVTINMQAEDYDENDILYYSVVDAPEGSTINAYTGVFTWTPSYEDAGVYNVVFSVSDGTAKDTQNVEIIVYNINLQPKIDAPSPVYVAESSTLVLDINASDPDDTPLEITTDFTRGSLNNGIFTWTPGYEDEGSYFVTFTVSDGELSVSQTVEVIVIGTNSAPVLSSITSLVVNELETVKINLTAEDLDGDELTFSRDVEFGELVDNVFTWTPGLNEKGFYEILFTVSDGQLSDSKIAIIAVGATNLPPSITHMGAQYIKENESLEFTLNATDLNNDSLSYSATGLPDGSLFNNSTGYFSWTPSYDQSGKYTVEFRVSDILYTAVDTVNINVENVNRAPIFDSIPICEVNETEQVKVNLSAVDPDGNSLSFSTDFENGKIIGDTFVWDTDYYDSGEYYIVFNVTDGDLYDSTTVYVKVNPTNMPPELESIGSHSIYENETLEFYVNATDADNDSLTYSVSGSPSGSSFDPETRLFHWIPSYRQAGTYSVEFHVTDGDLNDSEAITIRVYDVDDKVTDYSGFSSSSSSSGGGGGGTSAAEDYDNVAYKDYSIKYVTSGQQVEFKFPNSENDLESVEFTSLKAAGQVKAVIEILYDRSSLVSTNPPGSVYHYINIWVGDTKFNSGNYFSSAEVTFKVPKQWLEDSNADPASVKLYRYSGGSWGELKTSRIGTDVNNYYFKAQTPGFSPFAIVTTGSTTILRSSVSESTTKSTKATYDSNEGLNSINDVPDAEIMSVALEQEPASPFNTRIFFIGIVGILLIGSAVGYHSRNESPVLKRYYEAIYAFVLGMKNAGEWTAHKLSSESLNKDYAALGVKWKEIKTADYKAIYEKKLAEIKERQK